MRIANEFRIQRQFLLFTFYLLCGTILSSYQIEGATLFAHTKGATLTKYLHFNDADLQLAGSLIREGKLVAFPTETVYGLGANALDENAVLSTYSAKGRPGDNPLIVHVWCKQQIYDVAREVNADAEKIIDSVMPASITIVLPKKQIIPNCVTAGLDTVAIRMPKSAQARKFLQYCQVPVTAPSANTSSRPSPTTWQAVKEDMDGKIDAILCGDPCEVGIESTVVDLCGQTPLILRPGIITPQVLEKVLGKQVRVVTNPKEKVNSPGVRYKHYAPVVPMVLNLDGDKQKLLDFYRTQQAQGNNPVLFVEHPEEFVGCNTHPMGTTDAEVAQNLFENLRYLEKHFGYIIASFTSKTEFADSILNRMIRSASHNVL